MEPLHRNQAQLDKSRAEEQTPANSWAEPEERPTVQHGLSAKRAEELLNDAEFVWDPVVSKPTSNCSIISNYGYPTLRIYFQCMQAGWLVETPGAKVVRSSRMLLPGNMRGIVLTEKTIEETETLVTALGLPADEVPAALALAEQLRLVQTGIAVSEPTLSAHKNRPFSGDLSSLAGKIAEDVGIGVATKKPTARQYYPEELVVLVALYRVAVIPADAVRCFRLISKRSEMALTERLGKLIRDIQQVLKPS